MVDEIADKPAELAELDRQLAIRRTSLATGVPVEALQAATTADEAQALAESALRWKAATAPAPEPQPTAAVSYGVSQYTRENLAHMTADQVNEAYHAGRLAALGAPAPPRQNGSHRSDYQ